MLLLNYLAQFFTFFSAPDVILLLGILGFLSPKRTAFGCALILVAFTIPYNVYLKSLWQIPLPPTLPVSGWAFPSGHMHASMAFWGYLLFETKEPRLRWLLIVLLAGIGFGLVQLGYHYPSDVWGAIAFGTLSICLHRALLTYTWFKTVPARTGFIALATLPWFLIHLPETALLSKSFIWYTLGGLLGFSIGWLWLDPPSSSLKNTLPRVLMGGLFAYALHDVCAPLFNHSYGHWVRSLTTIGMVLLLFTCLAIPLPLKQKEKHAPLQSRGARKKSSK